MPAIGNLVVNLTEDGLNQKTLVPMLAIPGKQAQWSEVVYPELERIGFEYALRKPGAQSDYARHSFKATVPVMKSIVTDPSGPYQPPPVVDYVLAAELHLHCPPRATNAQRLTLVTLLTKLESSVKTLMQDSVEGKYTY